MRGSLTVVAAVSAVAALGISTAAASPARHGHHRSPDLLRFDTMAPVTEPFTGTDHPVRGVPGGGLPWELDRARGELRPDGRLDVRVEGLVLARRDPVPAAQQGTNPVPQFRAAVNCLTTPTADAPAAADIGVTMLTDPVPASPQGDARIRAQVALPHPCIAPIVFVTSPTGAWFAATGG